MARSSGLRRTLRQIQRDSYLVSRTAGDLNAALSPDPWKLPKRLIRRQVTRRVMRGIFGR